MEEIIVKVVDCSGKIIFNNKMLFESRVNQIYNSCRLSCFHCEIKLLYNNQIISPLKKISDIIIVKTTDLIIIFNIVLYPKNKYKLLSEIIIDTKGKIIDYSLNNYIQKYNNSKRKFILDFINKNYNCLNIISICNSYYHIAILFEDGMLVIVSYETQNIINIFYNLKKIFKTVKTIVIIINDLQNCKLIIFNEKNEIIGDNNKELNNLDCIDIYIYNYLIFIISKTYIMIVRNTNPLCIIKYEINNIIIVYAINIELYRVTNSGFLIAAIKEDNCLITFELIYNYDSSKLCIQPFEDIDKQFLKIRKILHILDESFIAITNDDSIYIWGLNKKLVKLYEELKTQLINVDDIVVSYNSIGILKKDNSIILIIIKQRDIISYTVYKSFNSKYKYNKIISTIDEIFALTDNNTVYILENGVPIEILNNIKDLYTNITNIIAISYDNIVYGYTSYKKIYYIQHFSDLKSIKINKENFMIIKNNGELIIIEIKYRNGEVINTENIKTFIETPLKDIAKFIEV